MVIICKIEKSHGKRAKILHIILAVFFASILSAFAQSSELKIPAEVSPFIDEGKIAIALESADLNGDGSRDFVLVIEDPKETDDSVKGKRSLLILTRRVNGKLVLAARNDKEAVYCRTCGGISIGDPFMGIEVGRSTFTINHYGGSAWRWTDDFTFKYSRRDKNWQLVRAEETSFHTSEPEKVKNHTYTPPKDFGKINLADFDPENYLKKKVRAAVSRN